MKIRDPTPKRNLVSERQILIDPVGSHPEEKSGQGETDPDQSRWIPPLRKFWVRNEKSILHIQKKFTLTLGLIYL